jgi:hypothetical protein
MIGVEIDIPAHGRTGSPIGCTLDKPVRASTRTS